MQSQLIQIEDWESLARQAHFRPTEMAALCPTSLRHLERFFGMRFHQTPGEWTRELRCRLARQLIAAGWSNKAVVNELGFVDHAHLCHEFKRIYGVPPREFAPRWRGERRGRPATEMSREYNESALLRPAQGVSSI